MKVDSKNYFSDEMQKKYMGVTQFKAFVPQLGGCEARAVAQYVRQDWKPKGSDAFLQGSYGHSWNEGKLEEFRAEHPEMFSTRGATKGQLKTAYKKIGDIVEMLEKDKLIMNALSGEKEVIFTAELWGMPWKCAIDSYNKEHKRFADLKFLKELYGKVWNKELNVYENVFQAYGYYIQLAIYAEIERLANGRTDYFEPFLVIATKESVPDKCVMSFNSEDESFTQFIQNQLIVAQQYSERVKALKYEGAEPHMCGKCDYCKSIKKLRGTTHYSKFDLY